ncbi:MarR family transcriptional regulator [Metallosphaera hakonensis]|uniref:HVO-A0261-like N-terminal domain-containing protein n=1 Tax=Metallosphaera hakonensis JCM 8857 = DSM 7519 TaxID=1293036 RepID=A0A2U9IWS6_9CREN|nr:MarR family transcriptional regulator [Metallosphaera hakonensis]AWS00414.1 hypothetical protein DFR87_12840 [Metallosphaera hakonensis JCM 8857 = DSM 7519]
MGGSIYKYLIHTKGGIIELCDPHLDQEEIRVLMSVSRGKSRNGEIAKDTRLSPSTVKRKSRSLVDRGYLEMRDGHFKVTGCGKFLMKTLEVTEAIPMARVGESLQGVSSCLKRKTQCYTRDTT